MDAKFLSLAEYENLTVRLLSVYGKAGWILKNEDAISYLMESLIRADARCKSELTRRAYRRRCFLNALTKVKRKKKEEKPEFFDVPVFYFSEAHEILESYCLTEIQRECLKRYYIDKEVGKNIAEDLDIPASCVYRHIKNGLLNLRKSLNE